MKISVSQDKLTKALNNVSRVAAGSRTTLAVLNNVLIRVDEGKVSLTTTNLDMAMVDYLPVSEAENGLVTVPARLLAEFVSNLPRGEVVEISNESDEKVNVKAGKYSSVMNGAPSDDFPELPEIDETKAVIYKIGVDEFKAGLAQVVVAASNDMTRPALTGIYFNTADGALYVAATDGYRLAERKLIDKVTSEVMAIVPTVAIQEVMRSIADDTEEVEILFDETQVRFRLGEIEITSKLIDGSYPDYRKLIPQSADVVIMLDKAELMRVTKLAALFAKSEGGSILLEASKEKGSLGVSSVANELGQNVSEIEVEVDKDEKVMLNSRFLIDALNALEEAKVLLGMSDNLAPLVLKNEKSNGNYTHIIMPLKR